MMNIFDSTDEDVFDLFLKCKLVSHFRDKFDLFENNYYNASLWL